jgi:hypothetical protein
MGEGSAGATTIKARLWKASVSKRAQTAFTSNDPCDFSLDHGPPAEWSTIRWQSSLNSDAMSYRRDSLKADDIMTVRELAAFLHMPESTVSYLARTGVIPSRKLGRRRIFIRPIIEEILLTPSAE